MTSLCHSSARYYSRCFRRQFKKAVRAYIFEPMIAIDGPAHRGHCSGRCQARARPVHPARDIMGLDVSGAVKRPTSIHHRSAEQDGSNEGLRSGIIIEQL